MVIMVAGLPGTGKSRLASALAKKLGARYLSTDQIRKKDQGKPSYTPTDKLKVYESMLVELEYALQEGQSVVLDGTFYQEALRRRFAGSIAGKSAFLLIEVTAPEALVHERLKSKRPDSDADYAVYLRIREQWEPIQEPHLVVNSGLHSAEEMLSRAESYIRTNHDEG